ncbi:hypothetical protein P9112_004656 [Eukaryota sp. TZLM1-RC]
MSKPRADRFDFIGKKATLDIYDFRILWLEVMEYGRDFSNNLDGTYTSSQTGLGQANFGQSRLCGYFLNDNQCGVIPCPTGRRYMTKPSPSKHSPNQYSVQNFNQYLNHWNLVRRKVYLESNRQKWKIVKFDNRRRKERRFRESLNKFQRLAGHPEKLYLAVGSANFPSHCRKVN